MTRRYAVTGGLLATRDENEIPAVGGILVPFDTPTVLDRFGGVEVRETFASDSEMELNERGVFYLVHHNRERPVASLDAGTLTYSRSDAGMETRAVLDLDDPDARSLWAKTKGGLFRKQSIGFIPTGESRTEERDDEGVLKAVDYRVESFIWTEASAVLWPAYKTTSLDIRELPKNVAEAVQDNANERRKHLDELLAEDTTVASDEWKQLARARLHTARVLHLPDYGATNDR